MLICFSVWLVQADIPSQIIASSIGEWDLQQIDFINTAIQLSGDVKVMAELRLIVDKRKREKIKH